MIPIHGERGKCYYAIKCQNPQCQEPLLLEELARPSWDDQEAAREKLQDLNVRCPICTRETPILQRQLYILEVR